MILASSVAEPIRRNRHRIVSSAETLVQIESWIPLLILSRRRSGRSRMPKPDRHTRSNGNKWLEHGIDHARFATRPISNRSDCHHQHPAVGLNIIRRMRFVDHNIATEPSCTATPVQPRQPGRRRGTMISKNASSADPVHRLVLSVFALGSLATACCSQSLYHLKKVTRVLRFSCVGLSPS
ncbi:hypothetical protein Pla52n_03590 [Stieleria varia]|uniref:Uncharacterized protein n=1 Tax=Stieleria varia TaxID=2528005 RepID=A0A5C6B672_9BACT|nr:hypothetical protein Pla52n_03590 [Stieleria varia]